MKEQNVRLIPVTENGRLAGLITFDDLVVDGSVGLDALLSIVTSQLEVEAPPKPAGLLHPQGPGQAEQRPVFGGAGPRGKAARRRTRSRPPSPGAATQEEVRGTSPPRCAQGWGALSRRRGEEVRDVVLIVLPAPR